MNKIIIFIISEFCKEVFVFYTITDARYPGTSDGGIDDESTRGTYIEHVHTWYCARLTGNSFYHCVQIIIILFLIY